MYEIPAHSFFSKALRMAAYDGALTAVIRRDAAEHPAPAHTPPADDTSPAELHALRMKSRQKEFAQYWDGQVEELDGESPEGQKALRGVVGA
jgi:hypothetical protein